LTSSGLEILRAGILEVPGVAHGFTTRSGGASPPPFDNLNLSSGRGDTPEAVHENRERVRVALGLESLVFAQQVHGRMVIKVDAAPPGIAVLGEADGLVTDRPGVGLVAQTADCAPVLLLDPDRPAVAAVHAGWRGAAQNIVSEAVRKLGVEYGSKPERLLAAIGPAISGQRYRVGPEVLDIFREVLGELDRGIVGPLDPEGGATLDVVEIVRRQLVAAGVSETRIERVPGCTFDDPRFFSSRRQGGGRFGGQGGAIGILVAERSEGEYAR
jgi:purine-nucleoside/S-methyl-5'-thioadenosine phosphorylase / adenosine deaminase